MSGVREEKGEGVWDRPPLSPGLASPKSRCVSPKNREFAGKWSFLSLEGRDGVGAGSRNAQGRMLETGRDGVGGGWDRAPQHPNSVSLIPKVGASRSFHSHPKNPPGRWDKAAAATAD